MLICIQNPRRVLDRFGQSSFINLIIINQKMQESYLSLPTRSKPKSTVLTNIYEIRAERLPSKYYLYATPEKLTPSARTLLLQHLRTSQQQPNSFYKQIGFICFYKDGFLGNTSINQPFTLQINEQSNTPTSFVLSKQREIDFSELINSEKGLRFMQTSHSAAIRRITEKRQPKITLHKYKNFVFEVTCQTTLNFAQFNYNNNKIWLTTDAIPKIQEHITLLDYIEKYSIEEVSSLLASAKIVKNYGKYQQLYFVSIDRTKNPTHKIAPQSELTYEQYYLKKYNIQIKQLTQPLILATKTKKSTKSPQYFVPELVSLADKSYMLDFPAEISSQLLKLKQILPQDKESSISQIIGELGAQDIIKKSAINLDAYQLSIPYIMLKNAEVQPEEGIFQFRSHIMQSPELKSWGIAYSSGNSANEKEDAQNLINYFRSLTRVYGVNITNNPSTVAIQGSSWDAWKSALEQNFKKYGRLQIILLYLKEEEEKYYLPLKELLTSKFKCPSQVIRKRTMHPNYCRKPYMLATEIMLQIITKVGAIPWDVKRQTSPLSQSLLMQGAITIDRTNQGYAYYLVGSTGKEQNLVFSYFRKNLKTKQDLKADLQNSLVSWAKSFVVNCRSPPQNILLYREARGQARQHEQMLFESGIFWSLGPKIGIKIKQANYNPNMAFINVTQQQKIEFYTKEVQKSDFILKNVKTGTVVFEESNLPKGYNFYLTSKQSSVDTTKPIKYQVMCNNEKITKQDLSQFTYESCYCYFNFQGAHSIPAMLKYSRKLNKLAYRFSSNTETDEKINRFHYYL